ncbi:hypothetical protein IWZ01DRAFT_478974 [Phyllosticta capitalensis]
MEQGIAPPALVESDNLNDPDDFDDSNQALCVPAAETPHVEAPDQVGSQSSDDDDDDDWNRMEFKFANDVPSIKLSSVSHTAHVISFLSAQFGSEIAKSSAEFAEQQENLQNQYRGDFNLPNLHFKTRKMGERLQPHVLQLHSQPSLSRFWTLSRELRESIYRYAMKSHSPIEIGEDGCLRPNPVSVRPRVPEVPQDERSARMWQRRRQFEMHTAQFARRKGETLTPGLLTANKQLYAETVGVLYSLNSFTMASTDLETFLDKTGGKADRHIRRLCLKFPEDVDCNSFSEVSCLERLPHLAELRLDFSKMGCKIVQLFAAKMFFRQAHQWIVEVAEKRNDKLAAAKLIKAIFKPPSTPPDVLITSVPPSKEFRREAISSFSADLRTFIASPNLAEEDEVDRILETGIIPRSYYAIQGSRWRIIEDIRSGEQPQSEQEADSPIKYVQLATGLPAGDISSFM